MEISQEKINNYLQEKPQIQITEEQKLILEAPFAKEEIIDAINHQKRKKTPGPDGIPVEVYIKLKDIILFPYEEVINEIRFKNIIPVSWQEAIITIIHKQGTDAEDIKNYRPISLINSYYKIFTNILANRFLKVLTQIIHQDQTGFLPRRSMRNNIRTIINVMEYYEQHPEKQMATIFIDAEKAFDNVSWKFMKEQLKRTIGDEDFVRMINMIYETQKVKIIINGECTDYIGIYRGTCQGCPLSPLLFILTLEVLNNSIRENIEIKGLKIRGQEYKILGFAGDLAIILEDPITSYEPLKQELDQYSQVTGMKVNLNKTKIITKNLSPTQEEELNHISGIQCVTKVKYLGIIFTNRITSLYEDNYGRILEEIERDLKKWENLQLSLLGRIATIKMSILPKILFLFQSIPIQINKNFFKRLNQLISKFIWKAKKPRISRKSLQDSKDFI